MNSEALVSAIITTHNRADLLPRAIDSVLRQTYVNLEIIVVDDGSRDETGTVVQNYQRRDDRIRYLRLEKSRGACAARNYGIGEAKGQFVAGLDDDDEWLPKRVEVLMNSWRDEYAYVCSPNCIIYRGRKVFLKRKRSLITLDAMLYSNITGNQVLTRKERILAVGGFDEDLTANQDFDLWLRLLAEYGKAKMVSEPLQNVYRDHLEGRISKSDRKISGEWKLYLKNKPMLNKKQRRVRLMELKRIKNKDIKLHDLIHVLNTDHFFNYFRYT
jgi:glycosyltransferase involved in cell wall biosynthesis